MPTRKPFQRERDLDFTASLYLQGWSQFRIAEKLAAERDYEVSRQTISNDLKAIQERWRQNTAMNLDDHRARELAKIDALEAEYHEQYQRSKEPRTINSKSAKSKPGSGKDKPATVEQSASERIEQREGNPAYLQGVERCIAMRVKLLGLNAPEKSDTTLRIIDMAAVQAELRRKIEAGEMNYEQALLVTDHDTTLVDELFKGVASRVSVSKD